MTKSDQTVTTKPKTRHIAAHWGIAKATKVDSDNWALTPIPEDQKPSPRMDDYMTSRQNYKRSLYPKVRLGYLRAFREDRDPFATKAGRGQEPFVRVTWNEAIKIAA